MCPSLMCYVYKVNAQKRGFRLKHLIQRLIWALKIRRYLERQREHGRDFQKRGSSSEEKGPRGSITGTEPDNQCGQNGKFREGQRHAGVGGDRPKWSGLEMERHRAQGRNGDKGGWQEVKSETVEDSLSGRAGQGAGAGAWLGLETEEEGASKGKCGSTDT